MTEKTPIDEEYEIAAARLLAADGWRPYTQPPQRGLDVRDWIDTVRVLLHHLDAAEARAKKCEDDWNLDLLKHTTQIRAERDAHAIALRRIRGESHWTTVHEIIDAALGKGP